MKITTALSTTLAACLALAACDKGDKKSGSSEKTESTETTADPAKAPAGDEATQDKPQLRAEATANGAGAASGTAGGTPGAGSAATEPGTGAGTGSGTAAAVAEAKPKAPAKLEVLSEGSEPRYQLTYQPAAGTKQTMTMSLDVTADVPMMGKVVMPTMIMTADAVVDSVKDGEIKTNMTFGGMEVRDRKDSMPGLADEMEKQMAKLKGSKMTMTIAPSGRVLAFEADVANDPALQQTFGQTQQSLDQMVAQLPDKAVGKGAKWKIKQEIEQQGMKVTQTITYELVDVTATTAHIKGVATMKAGKQEIEQQGMKVTLEKLDGSAKTDMTIDFTKMVPSVTGDMTMKMSMSVMGQNADVSMATKMKIKPD